MSTTAQTLSLGESVEAFLLSKQVGGLSTRTLEAYRAWLGQFAQIGGTPDTLAVQRFFTGLRERGLKPGCLHTAYRTLKTFFRWAVDCGLLPDTPLKGFSIRVPKTLPGVPTEEDLRGILDACRTDPIGKRNRAMILVLADSGLRGSELLHLLVEDWRPADRGLFVRAGKGRKDRVSFIGPTTARALKEYLATRRVIAPEDWLWVDQQGRPLNRRHLFQVLHRLSKRAGLPPAKRIHPHALRHYAATSWLRNGASLEEVRRLLGHESLNMTLRYSSLVSNDLQAAHRKAAAMERVFLR